MRSIPMARLVKINHFPRNVSDAAPPIKSPRRRGLFFVREVPLILRKEKTLDIGGVATRGLHPL
jgi:hypothetical protein